jgi:hypothetical protein
MLIIETEMLHLQAKFNFVIICERRVALFFRYTADRMNNTFFVRLSPDWSNKSCGDSLES